MLAFHHHITPHKVASISLRASALPLRVQMAEVMANAATSVLGSVIGKLAAMLTEKYQLARNVKHGIRFL